MTLLFRFTVALALLSGAAERALAEGARARVALLDSPLSGLSPDAKARFFGTLAEVFDGAGYEVIGLPEAQSRLHAAGVAAGCTIGPCMREVGRVLGVNRVIVGAVSVEGSNYDITLSLLRTEAGVLVRQSTERCDICTLDEGLRAMRRAAGTLAVRPMPSVKPPQVAPITPLMGDSPEPADQSNPSPWYHSRATKWVALGIGLAAIGVGVALIAVDGCTSTPARPNDRCPEVRDSSGAGIGLMIGGAALGAGALWFF